MYRCIVLVCVKYIMNTFNKLNIYNNKYTKNISNKKKSVL